MENNTREAVARQTTQESSRLKTGRWFRQAVVTVPRARTWIAFIIIATLMVGTAMIQLPRFLAKSDPIPSTVLVVEGWIPDYALDGAAEEFARGNYRVLVTTGGPLDHLTRPEEGQNYATLAAAYFRKRGVDPEKIVAVDAEKRLRNRTYESAVAFRRWFEKQTVPPDAINVYTSGFHARRTCYTFQYALGKDVRVGVIANPPRDYRLDRWWRASEGAKNFVAELIGYVYFRWFFAEP
jgi:uncharacterized SAM-binding protein YcdF (DUF218 family)